MLRSEHLQLGMHLLESVHEFENNLNAEKIVAADFAQRRYPPQSVNGVAAELIAASGTVDRWPNEPIFAANENGVPREIAQPRCHVDVVESVRWRIEQFESTRCRRARAAIRS